MCVAKKSENLVIIFTNMFNYNHLYYFYQTVRMNGVTKAAKSLRIAQPSLSIQLKTLEGELGLPLFEKVGRKLQLTPGGERVFEYCRKMFETAEELNDFVSSKEGLENKRCRIGVAPEIERPFVGDVLSTLLHKNKNQNQTYLSLVTGEHKDLIARLSHGEIDVIVTNHSVHAPNIKPLAELSMPVLAVANIKKLRHISSKTPLVKLLKQEAFDLVLPSETLKIRLESDLFLNKHKISRPVAFESDILSVVVRAVLEGSGIGFIPKHYIQKETSQGILTVLNNRQPLWFTKLYVSSRSNKLDDPTIQSIKKHFLKLGAKS